MGRLKDDVMCLRKDLENLQADIAHLDDKLLNCTCDSGLLDLIQEHVRDLDTHVNDVLAHVINTETRDEKIQTIIITEKIFEKG